MKTLIIPCAGRSSRFPNMRPKYLLTHPDGKLMVQKAIESLDTTNYDRIIIVIVKPHCEQYDANLILEQAFQDNPKVQICILKEFTSSASETIFQTISKMNINGSVTIKDSDNYVSYKELDPEINYLVGLRLSNNSSVTNIPAKSFIRVNENGIVLDIIEKEIVSNIICLGIYNFKNIKDFVDAYTQLRNKYEGDELYISHVVSYMLRNRKDVFFYYECDNYIDWGTLSEWRAQQRKNSTYFVDFDGVLIKNSGKYGRTNWSNNSEMLEENCEKIKELIKNGAQIIITTSRPDEYKSTILTLLNKVGIKPYCILTGLNHAPRVLINDFAPSNPYPSASAINMERNSLLKPYL